MLFLIVLAVLALIAIAATFVQLRTGGYGQVSDRPGTPPVARRR
ncbi:MAG: hypothetical protein JWQ64_1681 [Subtercola sp.]|jgi:hypothetical protein|nr:hypothetical protein [Subtercola sp.]